MIESDSGPPLYPWQLSSSVDVRCNGKREEFHCVFFSNGLWVV